MCSYSCFTEYQLDLNDWLAIAPVHPPSEAMMRWMSAFSVVCDKACCFSPECGAIRCSSCQVSFTSILNTHIRRYVCMGCPFVEVEDGFTQEKCLVGAFTLCSDCFTSIQTLHHHDARFCLIDEQGNHSQVSRPVPKADVQTLSDGDFATLPITHESPSHGDIDDGDPPSCVVCCCEFSASEGVLPVSPPGCPRKHGWARPDRQLGYVVDSESLLCLSCALLSEKANGRLHYVDIRQYCKMCQHEDEMQRWIQEFDAEVADMKRSFDNKRILLNQVMMHVTELKSLHKQPWIQRLVDERFSQLITLASNDSSLDSTS